MLTPFERFKRLIAVDKKEIGQVYIYALFNGIVNLSLPLGIQSIINLIQGGEISTAWGVMVAIVIIGIALTGLFQLMQLRIVENISQRIFARSAFEFAYRIPKIKNKALYNYYAPELANRLFDTLTIQKGLPKILIDFSLAAFQILVGLFVLSLYHSFFVFFGILLLVLVYFIVAFSGPRGLKTSLSESKSKYNIAHWLEEIARTKLSFKLANNTDIALKRTNENVSTYLEARESHFKVLVGQFLQLLGFKVLVAAGFLFMGGILVFRQEMNIGQFVAAEIIILLIISSMEKIISTLEPIYDVLTALEKIGYVTDMEMESDQGHSFQQNCSSISVKLENVSFAYPDQEEKILNKISFELPGDKSACIIGKSGSGKSTLIQILAGLFEPSQGLVKLNSLPLQSMDSLKYRAYIGYALSHHKIFLGTMLENITMNRLEISMEMVNKVIQTVKLDAFVSDLALGLDTQIDPDGRRIPRSVVDKITLARAIVNDPKLLLLEDPIDHVEPEERREIIKNIVHPSNPWTILISTVDPMWLEYIPNYIKLEEGRVTASVIN